MKATGKVLGMAAVAALVAVAALGAAVPAHASTATTRIPGAPTAVKAEARDKGALLSWKPPASDGGSRVTGYVIKVFPGGQTVHTSAVTTFLVGGLKNKRPYAFTVAAVNKKGTGRASRRSASVTPRAPSAPGSARSVKVAAGFEQISVSWAPPKSNGGAPITAYRLTTKPATTTVSVTGAARSATLTGLTDGRAYRVLVAAVNSAGRGKAATSAAARPHVTVPDVPTGVTAAPGSSGVVVSWQPPASDGGTAVTGYVITVAGTATTMTAPSTATSVTVTGLSPTTSYQFRVAAVNAQGTGQALTSPSATGGATAASDVVVLSSVSLAALTQVQSDGSMVFASPPAQVQDLTAGQIVVAGVSSATPQGFLGDVTSVSSVGSTWTVATTPASLDEALASAGFGMQTALTSGEVADFIPARRGVRMLPAHAMPASSSPGSIGFSLDSTLYKSSDGRTIRVKGDATLTPSMTFSAGISCCIKVTSSFRATDTASADVTFTAQLSQKFSGSWTLGTVDFDPIVFDVAGVPVVIVPELTFKLLANGSVIAGLTAGASGSVTVGVRASSDNSKVTATPIFSHTASYTPPTLYGSLTANGGVEGDLSATIDGIAGATMTDSLWLAKLSADITRNPWWTLSAENVLGLDMNLSLLGHTFAKYDATLSDVTVRLAQADDPYQSVSITPSPASTTVGGHLQLHAAVAGVAGQSVQWGAPAGNGSVTGAGLYTAPATPGTYEVTAVQAASGLKPAAYGVISVNVGAQPPGQPTNPAAASNGFGAATVTWKPPADDGGSRVTGYTITASPGGSQYSVAGSSTGDTIGNLTPGATYTFTITATNAGGTSLPSAPTSPVLIGDATGQQRSCAGTGSISTLVSGTDVISYVPKGAWDSSTTGIDVVNVAGSSVTNTQIPTGTDVINSCASNSVTGQTVCTANNNDVYILKGTGLDPSVATNPLTDGGSGEISFSGGSATTTGVSIDVSDNKALLALSVGGVGGFQFLDLSTDTFEPAFASQDPAGEVSEDPLIDPVHNLILSASEDSNYELINVTSSTSPQFYEHPVSSVSGYLDSSAEDCSTGIILAPAEDSDPSEVEIADISKATFTPGTPSGSWSAPEQVQTLTGSSLSAGPSGSAVAQGTNTGVVAGEFGGDGLTALALPTSSGSGATPAISNWVSCETGPDPSDNTFSMGDDPHTLAAYQSPTTGDAMALLVNEGATEMVIVDLTQMLNPSIVPVTGNVCDSGTLPSSVETFIPLP